MIECINSQKLKEKHTKQNSSKTHAERRITQRSQHKPFKRLIKQLTQKGDLKMGETDQTDSPPMRLPTTPASTPTTIIRNKDITLFDLHELMSITDRLGRAMMTPTPLWMPNPVNGVQGTLYDSVELKSVAKQLNQALRSAHRPEDLPYLHPRCLERLWRLGSVRKPRRIAGVHGADGGVKLPKPLVMKLWKKIKGAVLNRQQT